MRSYILLLLLFASYATAQIPVEATLIPHPATISVGTGTCDLTCGWTILGDMTELTGLLGSETAEMQQRRPVDCEYALKIELALVRPDILLPPEWYSLTVERERIRLTAPTEEGLFRASRTLIQLLEEGVETGTLPCLTITDWPRFGWRGMHLDVCRHFFGVEFVKKYIDLLARYKMNSFHWHLTEDQGWRIEIKSHPKLTEVGAWRKGSQVGPYSRREYDSIPYGGYYTQEEIVEVVEYAKARHINVVPEIELPGHAMAALAAYPHLGCTGGPYEVQKGWGVFEDVFCAGNDSVFDLLEDVLVEVMELFPSPYIHIGGDECPKEAWKTCAKCQGRMKSKGLKDEHELQSYFIQRIERFVNERGRMIIGWDEILEGGLAPNATVMSWQGIEGGIAAARSGHYAVMSPGSHCYFDHYQGDPANEPLAIGGYTTVQKVYSYEPIPAELKPEEHKYILGAQGNVWTEYILTPEHVEYMAVPRMLALAEVLWTPKEKRNEADFIARLEREFPMLEAMKVNASKSLYQVRIKPEQGRKPGVIKVLFLSPETNLAMNTEHSAQGYVLAGKGDPIEISEETVVNAELFDPNGPTSTSFFPVASRAFYFNRATARPITLSVPPHERYNDGGAFTLVDGITAQEKRVNTEWLGWKEGVTITVDLGSEQDVRTAGIGALNETYSWIHMPEQVELSTSTDGKTFVSQGSVKARPGVGRRAYTFDLVTRTRYIRITVKHPGKIPEGFPGAGSAAWMFLDEIEVR